MLRARSWPGLRRGQGLDVFDHSTTAILHHQLAPGFTAQPIVERQFHPLLPLAIHAGEADQMGGHFGSRVVALVFLVHMDARQVEGGHLFSQLRSHLPLEVKETTLRIGPQLAQQILAGEIQQPAS